MASDRCLAALRLSEGGSIRWMKTQKRHTGLPLTRYYCTLVLSSSDSKGPVYTLPPLFPFVSDKLSSLSTSVFAVPFTSTLDALSPHSRLSLSNRCFHAVLLDPPTSDLDSHELSSPMDRYQPTTNHPRERSLFVNPRIIRAFLCLRLRVLVYVSLRSTRGNYPPILCFLCFPLFFQTFPQLVLDTERSTTQYTRFSNSSVEHFWPVHARDTSCHCWQRARACVRMLTEPSQWNSGAASSDSCLLACRVRRRRRHRHRPRPRPRRRSSRSFVRSSTARLSTTNQHVARPIPRYRCARSRSINALRRFHGGGRTETAATASNGNRRRKERTHGSIEASLRAEGWRTSREGETKRGQPRRIRPNFSFVLVDAATRPLPPPFTCEFTNNPNP